MDVWFGFHFLPRWEDGSGLSLMHREVMDYLEVLMVLLQFLPVPGTPEMVAYD